MGRSWSEKLFADLSTGKKLVPRVPVRPLNEPCKTDGIRNPKRAESYASIAAAGKRRNDDEEKSPLSTLLPATPERQQKKGLAIQAENLKVDRKQKKQKTDPTPTKIKQQKAKTSSPLHDEWCCNCTKHSKCKTSRCECYQKQRTYTSQEITIDTRVELEAAILRRNQRHFSQAQGTPWTTTPLATINSHQGFDLFQY